MMIFGFIENKRNKIKDFLYCSYKLKKHNIKSQLEKVNSRKWEYLLVDNFPFIVSNEKKKGEKQSKFKN